MPHASTWSLRDTFTAVFLFVASAAFTLWQNTRVAVLWDLSYLLDSSYRISLGQIPYLDFPFAHAPLTFLLHAGIIHTFGRAYLPHILCAALESGVAAVITWRILLLVLKRLAQPAWIVAAMLAAPLAVLGIYAIYPHPIYDSDCILAVLVALYLLQRATESGIRNAAAGAAAVLPLFFKQNIGLAYLAATLVCVAALAFSRRSQRKSIGPQMLFCLGAAATLAAALLVVTFTAGLHNYFYWTITFAAQRRLPGFRVILDTYRQPSLLWTIPASLAGLILLRTERLATVAQAHRWLRPIAFLLLAAPFLWTIFNLALTSDPGDRADQFLALWPHLLLLSAAFALYNLRPRTFRANAGIDLFLPVILLATIHGTLLSQQLWGSTYALWPLLLLLIASLLTQVPALARSIAAVIAVTFLLCGGLYATSHERLGYVHLGSDPPTQIAHATLPELHGLSTPGPYIPDFEELVRFAKSEIPAGDGILLLPGEVPFFFATGRIPQFPILLFDPATDPYTPQQTLTQARSHNIQWLIVTRNLQLTELPRPDLPEVLHALQSDFVPYRTLTNYDIYRRR